MAGPNTNFDDVITTTLQNRSKKMADNFTHSTILLDRLSRKGKIKPVSGGRTIVHELVYDKNRTYKRYSGYEALNISPQSVFTAAEFQYKQAAVAVSISGLEMLQNSGPDALIDIMESRIENAEKTFDLELSADVYSDGTADGGKQIGGLQLLVSDAGTGTVGGIDSSTWTFWQNQVTSATTEGAGAVSASTIQTYMNRLYLKCVRGREKPDLIISANTYFRFYWESLQAIQRITQSNDASAGYESLKFMGADVVADGNYQGDAPASKMWFLNTDHIYLRPHRDRNMVPLNPTRYSTNQDALVKLIAWAGNLTIDNRQLQGILVP